MLIAEFLYDYKFNLSFSLSLFSSMVLYFLEHNTPTLYRDWFFMVIFLQHIRIHFLFLNTGSENNDSCSEELNSNVSSLYNHNLI